MTNSKPKRYSPLWVSLHWLIALLLGAIFILGFSTRNASFETYPIIINWHMFLGSSVLLLMLVRIIIRSRSPRPEPASAGHPLLDTIGTATHHLLYTLAILMPLTGMTLALSFNLTALPLPSPPALVNRWIPVVHLWTAIGLGLLIALHIGAAFYHQFLRKDNLLARMWYGPGEGEKN
jgi:cytochrome b561